jgi:hypothetical protein
VRDVACLGTTVEDGCPDIYNQSGWIRHVEWLRLRAQRTDDGPGCSCIDHGATARHSRPEGHGPELMRACQQLRHTTQKPTTCLTAKKTIKWLLNSVPELPAGIPFFALLGKVEALEEQKAGIIRLGINETFFSSYNTA